MSAAINAISGLLLVGGLVAVCIQAPLALVVVAPLAWHLWRTS